MTLTGKLWQMAEAHTALFDRPRLTEDEWMTRFPPLDEEDDCPVSSDEFDGLTPPAQVWSCIDDVSERDDRIIVSGIVPSAHAYWLSSVAVPVGEAYIVRVPRED